MTPATASPVAELRELIAASGVTLRAGDTILLGRVLEKVGPVSDGRAAMVAAEAILMVPRPGWLDELIGRGLTREAK